MIPLVLLWDDINNIIDDNRQSVKSSKVDITDKYTWIFTWLSIRYYMKVNQTIKKINTFTSIIVLMMNFLT